MAHTISCTTILFIVFIMYLVTCATIAPTLILNFGVGYGLLAIVMEIILLVIFGKFDITQIMF